MKVYNSDKTKSIDSKLLKQIILGDNLRLAWLSVVEYIIKFPVDNTVSMIIDSFLDNKGNLCEKTLLLAVRGLGKTVVGTQALVILLVLRNPNETIAIISATETQAQGILETISSILITDVVKDMFPDLIDTNAKWNKQEITVNRSVIVKEPTVAVYGIGSSKIVSKHFKRLILDDIVSVSTVRSKKLRDITESYFNNQISKATDDVSTTHFIGTHYHWDDMYARIEKQHNSFGSPIYKTTKIPAIIKIKGEEFFIKNFTKNKAEDILNSRLVDPLSFMQQYQQEIRQGDGGTFNEEWIDFYKDYTIDDYEVKVSRVKDEEIIEEKVEVYMAADLSTGESDDNFVIAVIGVSDTMNIYLLDMYVSKISFNKQMETIKKYADKWYMSKSIGIESVAYQKVLPSTMKETTTLPIVNINTNVGKEIRMSHFSVHFENNKVFLNHTLPTYPTLRNEMLSFPDGENDDTIDAFYLAYELFKDDFNNRNSRLKPGMLHRFT